MATKRVAPLPKKEDSIVNPLNPKVTPGAPRVVVPPVKDRRNIVNPLNPKVTPSVGKVVVPGDKIKGGYNTMGTAIQDPNKMVSPAPSTVINEPVLNDTNPQYVALIQKGYTPEQISNAWKTIQEKQKPVVPPVAPKVEKPKVEVKKEVTTPTTTATTTVKGQPDYQDISPARQTEIINNLEGFFAANPNSFNNEAEFKKTYSVGTGKRNPLQDQWIMNWYNGKKNAIATNSANQVKLTSLTNLNDASLANISSADAVFLMNNDPTTYLRYQKAVKDKNNLSIINAETPEQEENPFSLANIMKSFGIDMGTAETISTETADDRKGLDDAKAAYEKAKNQYESIFADTQKELEGTGATSAFINAMAAKRQREILPDYQAKLDEYNTKVASYNNVLEERKIAAAERSQKIQDFVTMYGLYQQTPQGMAELALSKYNAENPDLDKGTPAQQQMALNQTLDGYYKDYGMIIQRPKAQVVKDVQAYAKSKGISLSQALNENFIKPLQSKPEYIQIKNKSLGLDGGWNKLSDTTLYNSNTGEFKSIGGGNTINTTTSGNISPSGILSSITLKSSDGKAITRQVDSITGNSLSDAFTQMNAAGITPIIGQTQRDQKETIRAMAKTNGIAFNENNPNETAAKLRAAGHQVANIGQSKHETGLAIDMYGGKKDGKYLAPTKAQIDIMAKNGWKHMAIPGDMGHFEYVGTGQQNVEQQYNGLSTTAKMLLDGDIDLTNMKSYGVDMQKEIFAAQQELKTSGISVVDSKVMNQLTQAKDALNNLDLTSLGFKNAVGGGNLLNAKLPFSEDIIMPGTAAYNFKKDFNALMASLVTPQLANMKGLGSMSDIEFQNIKDLATKGLSLGLTESQFKDRYKQLQTYINKLITKLESKGVSPQNKNIIGSNKVNPYE